MFKVTAPNQSWSMDFVSDQLANHRRFRILNIVDDYSREIKGQLTEYSISGTGVARFLTETIEKFGRLERSALHAITVQSLHAKRCFTGVKT